MTASMLLLTGLLLGAATDAPSTETKPSAEPATAAPSADWTHSGEAFTVKESLAAADLLANPASFDGKTVLVEGRVADVCSKMGCWMVVAHEDQTMRVRMKGHAFFVDKQGKGKDCRIEGVVVAKEVDPATVAHFKSESRETDKMPENGLAAGARIYELVASGVAMKAPTP